MEDIRQKATSIDIDFLLTKLNKLSSAIYLVTSFLKDQEPLKWKLRELASKIILDTDTVSEAPTSYRSMTIGQLVPLIKQVTALIELCLLDGSVSEMNFSILKKEFRGIKDSLETSHNDFNFNHLLPAKSSTISSGDLTPLLTKSPSLSAVKPKPSPERGKGQFTTKKGNNRQPLIVSYIRSHGWSAIKDVAAAVPGCGTKTIQRELSALVSAGTLKKKGERRWSRYQLA